MRRELKFSNHRPRVNVNQNLSKLRNGYQDLVDRYGADDALVLELKAEIERRQDAVSALPAAERRQVNRLSDAWDRHAEIASL